MIVSAISLDNLFFWIDISPDGMFDTISTNSLYILADFIKFKKLFSKDSILYSDALEPSEMLKRAKLRGAELFYQEYICMIADIRRTGKCNDERMKKRFEDYIFSEEFRQTAYRVLSITPQEIIRNAEKFVDENLDKIKYRKYSAIRFLRLDGRKPSDSDGEM